MRTKRLTLVCVLTLVGALAVPPPATADPGPAPGGADQLEVYTGTAGRCRAGAAAAGRGGPGHSRRDATAPGHPGRGGADRPAGTAARRHGVELTVKTVQGRPASGELRRQSADGYTVFRSYSEPGGIRDELVATAARFPELAKVATIGRTARASRSSRSR